MHRGYTPRGWHGRSNLRDFERVPRLGSFYQAAKALYVWQPALSRQIASLEREQLEALTS
jgi:DNA-binding transcriptional LysR family regulator